MYMKYNVLAKGKIKRNMNSVIEYPSYVISQALLLEPNMIVIPSLLKQLMVRRKILKSW